MSICCTKNMSEKLSTVKTVLHLTYQKIADATGVSQGTAEHYVKGFVGPSEDWINRFCEHYHVDREWLVSPDDSDVRFVDHVGEWELRDSSGAGERLKQLREELGLSLADMYNSIGITRAMYYRIETGKSTLTMDNARKIEALYRVGAEWLLYGDESRKKYPVSQEMIEYLWKNKDERRALWEKIRSG